MSEEPPRRRVLFVDDEPAILESLGDSLRKYRKKWDMCFEQYPLKAIELINAQPFDVVISDMRMPEMDGAALLTHVRKVHPAAVRIILSGFTELEVAIRAVSVAHQFLTKPCDAQTLESVVERACRVQQLLQSDELRSRVGKTESIPTTPQIFAEVTEVMTNPNATATTVARVIERDPGMCAKLLQMSNSGFFRLAKPISKVEDAVLYLGFNMIKNLVLSTEVFSTTLVGSAKRSEQRAVQEHSVLTAHVAMAISPEKRIREDAFLAGVLHDVGMIILSSSEDDYQGRIQRTAESNGCSTLEAEEMIYGVTHAEAGAYLLGLWGVPFNIVEAVAFHHRPQLLTPGVEMEFDTVAIVAMANLLAHETSGDKAKTNRTKLATEMTTESLAESLGVTKQLPEWRALAVQSLKLAKGATARVR